MPELPPMLPGPPHRETREQTIERLNREIEEIKKTIADIEERWRQATDPLAKKAIELQWAQHKNKLAERIMHMNSL